MGANFMVDAITSFTKDSVYKNWFPGGVFEGLFKSGLYDTSPFFDSLKKKLSSRPMGNRNFTITATEDTTGDIVLFNESMVQNDSARLSTYVRASSAIPGLFESVKVDGHVLSDGGAVMGVDIFSAVDRCRQLVESDSDIVVDIVTCDSQMLKQWDQSDDKTVPLLLRGLTEQNYNKQMADILDACQAYPEVNWRYYIEPPASGLPSNGINFDKTQMLQMVAIGKAQAANATIGAACSRADARRNSHRWGKKNVQTLGRKPVIV